MNKKTFEITIGIDIAKLKFDVACLIKGKYKHKYFSNDESGYSFYGMVHLALRRYQPIDLPVYFWCRAGYAARKR